MRDGTAPPSGNGAKDTAKKREQSLDKLKKATKEVDDLVKDIKDDDGDDDAEEQTEAKPKK